LLYTSDLGVSRAAQIGRVRTEMRKLPLFSMTFACVINGELMPWAMALVL
jgi:hypothetical protein